ncbi:related to dihydrodipicolinate synthase [Cephalotrichum gorgonifer]|uniref:Related to dihydrodipicolinate synthase n=1 Tax=Cephalotrichum gorgonifer TaxID=2041049 RepID=A0AAE8MNE2_9PEZI|nr:related to dihydrodipicolinate synthase [Cephalotrichum gorgonifer]
MTSMALTPPPQYHTEEMGAPKAPHLRLPDGVYVPSLAFFTPNEDVDSATLERHIIRLIDAGVAGIVIHGSNGEAVHLSHAERAAMIRVARDAILHEGSDNRIPLIAGCGAQSTREAIELCIDAAKAGATHALILPPSYYNSLLDDNKVVDFFYDVADRSPIPVLVYNFPAAASGRDLSSDTILRIAQHPNVLGVKLTCGNTGKLARLVADVPEGFFVSGGSADFILQGQVVGGNGTISGLANIAPRCCVRVMRLYEQGRMVEARQMQAALAKADWTAIQTGFAGVKAAMVHFSNYGGVPRKPCSAPSGPEMERIATGFDSIVKLERSLEEAELAGSR